MRKMILAASAVLALSGCGRDEVANTAAQDVNLMATDDMTLANDTTAIDAATGMDANMAADAELMMNETNLSNEAAANEAEATAANAM